MIQNINIPFQVGDVVWHKNLVTNEAIQTVVESYTAIIHSDGSKYVLFHLADKTTCVNVFATKEECDSYLPYILE